MRTSLSNKKEGPASTFPGNSSRSEKLIFRNRRLLFGFLILVGVAIVGCLFSLSFSLRIIPLTDDEFVVSSHLSPRVFEVSATEDSPATEVELEESNLPAPHLPLKVSASDDLPATEMKLEDSDLLAPYLPLNVFQQYQKWHSAESLEKSPHNRTFAVGYYSCPLEAGNRLHHFFNGLLWAVVTNRTYLWKYFDRETCLASPKRPDGSHLFNCNATNRVEDCDAILERAAWLPSYDEWAPKLSLAEPQRLHYWSTRPKRLPWYVTQGYPWKPEYVNETGVDARNDWQVVTFPPMIEVTDYLSTEKNRNYLLRTEAARDIATKIHSNGVIFMFGMFFRHVFTMVEESLANTRKEAIDPSVYSVGLHSRHIKSKFKGGGIQREKECLADLLQDEKRGNRTCEVYLMSDREVTITKLQKFVESSTDCTVRVAIHAAGKGVNDEHGPWSGLGFYQDWALSSRARHGFVHTGTTSSSLVIEMITYDQQLEAWRQGRNVTDTLEECKFQPKYNIY